MREIAPGLYRWTAPHPAHEPDADPARLAAQFAHAGAAAISILVDERFGGSIDDLRAARAATSAPLLAKGFFKEESVLSELRAAGADAALLLLRDVENARAAALMSRLKRSASKGSKLRSGNKPSRRCRPDCTR